MFPKFLLPLSSWTRIRKTLSLVAAVLLAGCRSTGDSEGTLSDAEVREIRSWAHYGRGLLYEAADRQGALGDAEYAKSLALDPGNVDLAIRLARQYIGKRKPEAAVSVLRSTLKRRPNDVRLQLFLAYSLQLSDKIDDAMVEFQRLVDAHPEEPAGYVGLCHLWLEKKNDDKAIRALEKGFKRVHERQFLMDNTLLLANRYEQERMWAPAIRCLRLAQAAEPADAILALSLYQCFIRAGQPAEADRLIASVPEKERTSPRFRFVEAKILFGVRRYADALTIYESLYRDLDHSLSADAKEFLTSAFFHEYGAAAERTGDIPKAEKLLQRSIELDPKNDEALNYLAYVWAERGINLDRALEYVQRALEVEPENAAYLDTLGWIYFQQKRPDLALTPLQRAHQADPEEAVIADHLGDVFMLLGRVPEAVESWRISFMGDPANATVRKKLLGQGIDLDALRRERERRQAQPPDEAPESPLPAPPPKGS